MAKVNFYQKDKTNLKIKYDSQDIERQLKRKVFKASCVHLAYLMCPGGCTEIPGTPRMKFPLQIVNNYQSLKGLHGEKIHL